MGAALHRCNVHSPRWRACVMLERWSHTDILVQFPWQTWLLSMPLFLRAQLCTCSAFRPCAKADRIHKCPRPLAHAAGRLK